jgi:hypothetical protein
VGAAEVGQPLSVDVNAGRELHGPSVALDMPAASPSGGVKPRHPLGFGVTPVTDPGGGAYGDIPVGGLAARSG